MRWITVGAVGQPGLSIVLEPPAAPGCGITEDERRAIAEMMAKGSYAGILLATRNLDDLFERLQAGDAEVVQDPVEQPYGFATAPSAIPRATWSASKSCADRH